MQLEILQLQMCELPKARNEEAWLELFYVFVNFCWATGGGWCSQQRRPELREITNVFLPLHHGVAPHCDPDVGSNDLHLCNPRWWPVTSVGTPEQETGSSIVTSHLLQLTSDTDVVPVHLAHCPTTNITSTPWSIHDIFTLEIIQCRTLSSSFCQYYQWRLIMLHL